MHAVADTRALVKEGIITPEAASHIQAQSRQTMMHLAINALLCGGITAATIGMILWLADALSVAIVGTILCLTGGAIILRGQKLFAMFGQAASLIGAGMMIGGGGLELMKTYPDTAGAAMTGIGALIAAIGYRALKRGPRRTGFVAGSIALMGVALHLTGIGFALHEAELAGLAKALFYLYAAGLIALSGWAIDVRLVTALAIVPFAQVLDTGTAYFHAAYVFYSPESTLSILQMTALIGALLWIVARRPERDGRHAMVLAILAFVVANLCALVGSLWGDVVGETVWGPGYRIGPGMDWDTFRDLRADFHATALFIPDTVYSVLWAGALAALIGWSAHTARRGLFNASVTFAAIHAYTQAFETFYDKPLAYVIGGSIAIPLAWGLWRLNLRWLERQTALPA